MSKYSDHVSNKNTAVSEKLFGRDMVENSTGGFVFELGNFGRLERFLILGCEGGTYYTGERKLTRENAQCIWDCVKEDPVRTVQTIVQISDAGRAIKNDPAVFALAMCAASGNAEAQALAYQALPQVCRIGTHLFQFVSAVDDLRGWGKGLRDAVANWYLSKTPDQLARQVTKYQQRDGWSHRDVLRLCHAHSPELQEVLQYVCQNDEWAAGDYGNEILEAVYEARTADESRIIELINEAGLEREHVPTQFLNSVGVWEALLPNLRQTALIRNLGKLTSIGLLKPLSSTGKLVADKIANQELLNRGRVHPFSVLLALKTYESGHGFRGSLSWSPDSKIIQALDDAFYMAFDAIEPCGKNFMMALDISGSMSCYRLNGTNITPRAASGCLAMTSVRTEPNTYTVGFSNFLIDIPLTKQMSIADVERKISGLPFGYTNPSLAIQHAIDKRLEVDTFVVVTDNEVNSGRHNTAVLEEYRQKMGRDARCIIVGMTATNFTIADPKDPRQLDIVGFDASGPSVISEFSR